MVVSKQYCLVPYVFALLFASTKASHEARPFLAGTDTSPVMALPLTVDSLPAKITSSGLWGKVASKIPEDPLAQLVSEMRKNKIKKLWSGLTVASSVEMLLNRNRPSPALLTVKKKTASRYPSHGTSSHPSTTMKPASRHPSQSAATYKTVPSSAEATANTPPSHSTATRETVPSRSITSAATATFINISLTVSDLWIAAGFSL